MDDPAEAAAALAEARKLLSVPPPGRTSDPPMPAPRPSDAAIAPAAVAQVAPDRKGAPPIGIILGVLALIAVIAYFAMR